MKEDQDILLVYSASDDQPIEGLQDGWVRNFHKFLQTLLSQLQKDEAKVVMVEADALSATQLEHAAAVLCLLTPEMKRQNIAMDQISAWVEKKKGQDDLFVDGVSRLFKIRKNNFDVDEEFPSLAALISYDLFYFEGTTGKTVEYHRFFGSDSERGYWMKLIDIAYDIIGVVESNVTATAPLKDTPREKTVYLASTGLDMLMQRDMIKRELKSHGYEVLPSRALPKDLAELEHSVREDLAKCRLSIHLIGEDYGYKPLGSDMSVVEVQNNIADIFTTEMVAYNEKHNNEKPFSRLIWLSPDLKNVSERQRLFIEDIKSKAAMLDEAEVLQIQLQELKAIIKEELLTGGRINFRKYTQLSDAELASSEKQVYLISDKADFKASEKLAELLEKQGIRVLKPVFEGDVSEIRTVHQENLRRCDGSIIYYGEANSEWIRTKLSDLLKAPGLGRSKPLKVKAVYLSNNEEIDVSQFEKTHTLVLKASDNLKA
ncbi:MAG: hypothetical protein ACI9DM_002644, partial [Cyclobacteriaceae bacterium]